jgi:parallel beta-helix repeat protein
MLFASFSALTSTNLPLADDRPQKAIISAYTVLAPIIIDGNSGFLGKNNSTGISWGNGTASDPYIIEGWDIDASSSDGISIKNSDVHFIVRDCYIHDGRNSRFDGIHIYNCENGVFERNTCSNNFDGIALFHSSNNTLSNNTCSNNDYGIYLNNSSGNTISNNDCSGNANGIYLYESSGNTLINNDLGESNLAIAIAAIVISIVVVVIAVLMRRKKKEGSGEKVE